jgi:tetratricopeptide (TPR) repeat protein
VIPPHGAWGTSLSSSPPVLAVFGIAPAFPEQHAAATLTAEAGELYQAGKFDPAVSLAQRGLAIPQNALGPFHPDVATALDNLAVLYHKLGRDADKEPLYKRALAIGDNRKNRAATLTQAP